MPTTSRPRLTPEQAATARSAERMGRGIVARHRVLPDGRALLAVYVSRTRTLSLSVLDAQGQPEAEPIGGKLAPKLGRRFSIVIGGGFWPSQDWRSLIFETEFAKLDVALAIARLLAEHGAEIEHIIEARRIPAGSLAGLGSVVEDQRDARHEVAS